MITFADVLRNCLSPGLRLGGKSGQHRAPYFLDGRAPITRGTESVAENNSLLRRLTDGNGENVR